MGIGNSEATADMGHGQMVTVKPTSGSRWEIVFSKEGAADYPAPPARDVQIEAIDGKGMVNPLLVVAGSNKSVVLATGKIEGALRARVIVQHTDHAHTREVRLPGADDIPSASGPAGGALIDMGHDNLIEVTAVGDGSLELKFLAQKAPPVDDVVMEAIYKEPADFQVRRLRVAAGASDTTLIAKGDTKNCSHIRLAIMHGDHFHTRTTPMAL